MSMCTDLDSQCSFIYSNTLLLGCFVTLFCLTIRLQLYTSCKFKMFEISTSELLVAEIVLLSNLVMTTVRLMRGSATESR